MGAALSIAVAASSDGAELSWAFAALFLLSIVFLSIGIGNMLSLLVSGEVLTLLYRGA